MVKMGAGVPVGLCLGTLFLTMLAGCASVLDIPSSPEVVATGPWRCLQTPSQPAMVTSAMADVRVTACDFITNCTTTVTGLTAKLCDKRDVGCNSPRLTGLSDVNGEFRFQVPTAGGGFDGYLEVMTPAALCTDTDTFGAMGSKLLCGLSPMCNPDAPDVHCYTPVYIPSMLFFNPPIARSVSTPIPLQLFPSAALPAVLTAAGSLQIVPGTGSLLIQALDCDGKAAAGVSFRVVDHQEQVQALYVKNGLVNDTVGMTDVTGFGGLVGVPTGFVQVQGVNDHGVLVGELAVQSAPSLITYTVLVPSASP